MTWKLIDLYTNKVLGEYELKQVAKAESYLDHQYGETRYSIRTDSVKKTKTKKASVKKARKISLTNCTLVLQSFLLKLSQAKLCQDLRQLVTD